MFVSALLAATLLPFSSDVALAALVAAGMDPAALFVAALAGNWIGGMLSYYLGRLGKWTWIERYLRVHPDKVERLRVWIDRYGAVFALVTWLPGIGDPLAVALGFARTPVVGTALWMLLGKGLRYAIIIWLTMEGVSHFGS